MTDQSGVADLRTIRIADVYKAGRLAAQLRRTPTGTEFEYLGEYLSDGRPVATTLPLSDEVRRFPAGAVPPFFAGVLPEGRRLTALQRQIKTSADDEFSLLLAVGGDVVGDVQVVPSGTSLGEVAPLISVQTSFSEVRFSDFFGSMPRVDRAGIAGVQDKASAGMMTLPAARAASRYILKIDPPDYPHVVRNEFYFLNLARASGIRVTDAELVTDSEGRQGLLVTRFDRVRDSEGRPGALASEDACQLLDLWPADKYNVTAEQLVARVAAVCLAGPVAVRDVFRLLCFAWITGNGDVHAKNISVLATRDGEWRVSPAYDLPSTLPYGDLTMALSMANKTDGFSRRQLLDFGVSVGMTMKAAQATLDDLMSATENMVDELSGGAVPFSQHEVSTWTRRLSSRRRALQA